MDINNCKTWIIGDKDDITLYQSKNSGHLSDLEDYSIRYNLRLSADTIWEGSIEIASQNNIVSINNGEDLIIFFPETISDNQKSLLSKLKDCLSLFKRIYPVKVIGNKLDYEAYENDDETVTEVEYLFKLIQNSEKRKKLA